MPLIEKRLLCFIGLRQPLSLILVNPEKPLAINGIDECALCQQVLFVRHFEPSPAKTGLFAFLSPQHQLFALYRKQNVGDHLGVKFIAALGAQFQQSVALNYGDFSFRLLLGAIHLLHVSVNGNAGIGVEYILSTPVTVRTDVFIFAHRIPPL